MKTDTKTRILNAIRAHQLPPLEHPGVNGPWITYPDRVQQFSDLVEGIGGRTIVVAQRDEISGHLESLPQYREAGQIVSHVAGVGTSTVDAAALKRPHDVRHVEFAIVEGELGVAENGAIYVPAERLRVRSLLFLTQHLALVLESRLLVSNMHEAYARLAVSESPFGVFVAGPSKTADIEQSLVIGAHGSRSLTVFLISDAARG